MLQTTVNGGRKYEIEQTDEGWTLNGAPALLDAVTNADGIISILHKGRSYTALVESIDRVAKEVKLRVNGGFYTVSVTEPIDALLASMGLDLKASKKAEPVKAPMPGMILKILAEVGQQVEKGDRLLILEAMKMENVLKATHAGTVKAIRAVERTAVEKGAVLIEME